MDKAKDTHCNSGSRLQLLDHRFTTFPVSLEEFVEIFSVLTTPEQHFNDLILWGDLMVRIKSLHELIEGADIACVWLLSHCLTIRTISLDQEEIRVREKGRRVVNTTV